jgi:hypothetical protein
MAEDMTQQDRASMLARVSLPLLIKPLIPTPHSHDLINPDSLSKDPPPKYH